MSLTTEKTFESAIAQFLVQEGGYTLGEPAQFNAELCLIPEQVIAFLKETQLDRWQKLIAIHGPETQNRIIARLHRELDLRGSLDVLRKGITDYGVKFQMAFFQPATNLNPDTIAAYDNNRLQVFRQVFYSTKHKNSVDMVLALNGIPVATLELKNQFTGQNTRDALRQYGQTRDNREMLFAIKKRTLVHFAVDQDEVYMTTYLDGPKTRWLPFNRGHNNGKGNPTNPHGYRTQYLWEEVLQRHSWLEIIQRFIHLETKQVQHEGRTITHERVIFPRYHQLTVVRNVAAHAAQHGPGQNYLIQHSAGSGKSNSIAWLSYRLHNLHDAANQPVFNTIIVITDRKVLDNQLQDTIYQFEHKGGVVQKIDKDSDQLATALNQGSGIIITTLQKFPYVVEKVAQTPGRRYAVIIDEAHSSQGGEASKKMKEVLSAKTLEQAAQVEAETTDYDPEDLIRECVEQSAAARGGQANISFFAFTATPKAKTLQVFGQPDSQGKPKPFHLYSMRQAIEEEFILDVLRNYITYELFFKLTKAIEEDPKLNKKKAAKAIGKYVSLHPHNLAQKAEIMIEHFRHSVAKKIGGRAKAMVVCGSRLHAKRYFDEFRRYIKLKDYSAELKVLVAFSGKVVDDDYPEGVSEPELTGYRERELPEIFDTDDYKVLIVADKYQTGFDQPMLHTMYVDKKLSGVKAVQTLSRLNRTCPGKDDTFVLDFANDRQTILDSFQPYYEVTSVIEETDINHLYDLRSSLDTYQVYWLPEIDEFANIYFNPGTKALAPSTQRILYKITDRAVDRYKQLPTEDKKDDFKKALRTWTNVYAFVAQIMPVPDAESEKFYAYAKHLLLRLPKRDLSDIIHLDDEIAMEYYRLQKIQEGNIELAKDQEGQLSAIGEAGLKRPKEEEALLSEIITVLNDRFGTEFQPADRLFFEQIEADLLNDDTLRLQANANPIDTFKYAFEDQFIEKLITRLDQNKDIFERVLSDEAFGQLVKGILMRSIYKKFREE